MAGRGLKAAVSGAVAVACLALAAAMMPAANAAGAGARATTPTAAVCAQPPKTADPQATAQAAAVYQYLYSLTCGTAPVDGVISGQNIGHGSQATDTSGLLGYQRLIGQLDQQTGHYAGLVGLDYEHDFIFTPQQLAAANQVLIGHAQRGGLVTVNFSPQSPWLNDESNIAANPGVWTNTRTDNGQLNGVNLSDILNPATPAGQAWQRKLTRIADALTQLRDAGIVVLWRPMQEMNGYWFWWGTTLQKDNASIFIQLWRNMYQYFTQVRHLDNLLWVYSPATYPTDPNQQIAQNIRSAAWAYPGDSYVDIVAGTSYDDNLLIPNYQDYLQIPKVIGEGEYGPSLSGNHVLAGDFDTRLYATTLQQNYPAVAYWLSWHDYEISSTQTAHLSLIANQNATSLLANPYVINAGSINIPSGSPSSSPSASASASASASPSASPSTSPSASPSSSGPSSGCAATYQVVGSWTGQFQAQVTVRNSATAPTKGWTVSWTFSDGSSLSQVWGGDSSASHGSQVTVRNLSYNGVLGSGSTTTFGLIANEPSATIAPISMTCTSS